MPRAHSSLAVGTQTSGSDHTLKDRRSSNPFISYNYNRNNINQVLSGLASNGGPTVNGSTAKVKQIKQPTATAARHVGLGIPVNIRAMSDVNDRKPPPQTSCFAKARDGSVKNKNVNMNGNVFDGTFYSEIRNDKDNNYPNERGIQRRTRLRDLMVAQVAKMVVHALNNNRYYHPSNSATRGPGTRPRAGGNAVGQGRHLGGAVAREKLSGATDGALTSYDGSAEATHYPTNSAQGTVGTLACLRDHEIEFIRAEVDHLLCLSLGANNSITNNNPAAATVVADETALYSTATRQFHHKFDPAHYNNGYHNSFNISEAALARIADQVIALTRNQPRGLVIEQNNTSAVAPRGCSGACHGLQCDKEAALNNRTLVWGHHTAGAANRAVAAARHGNADNPGNPRDKSPRTHRDPIAEESSTSPANATSMADQAANQDKALIAKVSAAAAAINPATNPNISAGVSAVMGVRLASATPPASHRVGSPTFLGDSAPDNVNAFKFDKMQTQGTAKNYGQGAASQGAAPLKLCQCSKGKYYCPNAACVNSRQSQLLLSQAASNPDGASRHHYYYDEKNANRSAYNYEPAHSSVAAKTRESSGQCGETHCGEACPCLNDKRGPNKHCSRCCCQSQQRFIGNIGTGVQGGGVRTSNGILTCPEQLAAHTRFLDNEPINPWSLLEAQQKEDYYNEIIAARRANRLKEIEQREFLDAQLARRQKAKEEEKRLAKKQAEEAARQREIYAEKEAAAKALRLQKGAEERAMVAEQAAAARARLEAEAAEERREGELFAAQLAKEAEAEREALVARRAAARAEVIKFAEWNKANKDKQRLDRAREAAEDERLQKEFLERLAREEAAREEELIKLHARMTRQQRLAGVLEQTMASKAAEDERRANAYTAARNAAADAAAAAAEQHRRDEDIKMRQHLAMQVQAKAEKKAADAAQKAAEEKALCSKAAAEAAEIELRERAAVKMARERQQSALAAQVLERRARRTVVMSETERQINAGLLGRVVGVGGYECAARADCGYAAAADRTCHGGCCCANSGKRSPAGCASVASCCGGSPCRCRCRGETKTDALNGNSSDKNAPVAGSHLYLVNTANTTFKRSDASLSQTRHQHCKKEGCQCCLGCGGVITDK